MKDVRTGRALYRDDGLRARLVIVDLDDEWEARVLDDREVVVVMRDVWERLLEACADET